MDVGERVGGARDAELTLWPRTQGVVEASDVVMAPEGCYMWDLRRERHSINKNIKWVWCSYTYPFYKVSRIDCSSFTTNYSTPLDTQTQTSTNEHRFKLLSIHFFHVHDFGGFNKAFNIGQSTSSPGFTLQHLNNTSQRRQTRSAITPTPRGQHPSTTTSTIRCDQTGHPNQMKFSTQLPQRPLYYPLRAQPSETTTTLSSLTSSKTASSLAHS